MGTVGHCNNAVMKNSFRIFTLHFCIFLNVYLNVPLYEETGALVPFYPLMRINLLISVWLRALETLEQTTERTGVADKNSIRFRVPRPFSYYTSVFLTFCKRTSECLLHAFADFTTDNKFWATRMRHPWLIIAVSSSTLYEILRQGSRAVLRPVGCELHPRRTKFVRRIFFLITTPKSAYLGYISNPVLTILMYTPV